MAFAFAVGLHHSGEAEITSDSETLDQYRRTSIIAIDQADQTAIQSHVDYLLHSHKCLRSFQ
jgi:hypothetical protein